jgi:glycosyltransferase involved in cell wall biosynthesis
VSSNPAKSDPAKQEEQTLLKALLVSPVGEHGGGEQVLLSLLKHLPACGVEPVLVCLRPGPLVTRAQQQDARVYVFRDHRMRDLHRVWQGVGWLRGIICRERADVIHSNLTAHLYGSLAAKLARVPELWHLHDYPYTVDNVLRLQLRQPGDFTLFTTEKVRSGFPGLHGRPHAVVAPTCTEPDMLRAYPPRPDVRARYGLGAGPLFLTVARLQEHKGHQHLIEAVPRVAERYPDAQFALVGKASDTAQERYQDTLRARCRALGIQERVHFTGYVPEADLVALYREAAALVHPATSEGFGLTLLDAMALGTPVIAARADGPAALLRHETTGLLVPVADPPALAQMMLRLLDDNALAQTLRTQGQDEAERHNAVQMAAQTAQIYRRMTRGDCQYIVA